MAQSAAERQRALRARRRAMRQSPAAPAAPVQQLTMADVVEAFPEAPSMAAQRGRHRDYLRILETKFPGPLGVLASIYATPVEELARALSCTKLEAQRERRAAAEASLPYWHQKQAIAIDTNGVPLAPVQVVISAAAAEALGFAESEQDQRVIEGDAS